MRRPWITDYDGANCTIGAAVGIIGESGPSSCCARCSTGSAALTTCSAAPRRRRQVLSDRLARLVDRGLLRKVPYQEQGSAAARNTG